MDVGIGLPNAVPGATGAELVEWARRADARGFGSLGTIDRVVYDNYEPLIALAGARFALGIGLGAREDDYEESEVELGGRGRRLDQMLERIVEVWRGVPLRLRGGRLRRADPQPVLQRPDPG